MTTIVIASNREESMHRWLAAWQPNLGEHRVILVEDSHTKTFDLNTLGYSNFEHYAWDDIDRDLGGDSIDHSPSQLSDQELRVPEG